MMAAGPLARVARPRKKPKQTAVKEVEEAKEGKDEAECVMAGASAGRMLFSGSFASGTSLASFTSLTSAMRIGSNPTRRAAKTMAMVSMAAKGMSVAAA